MNKDVLKVFVGYDAREDEAYNACRRSILSNTDSIVHINPLVKEDMAKIGLYYRDKNYPNEVAATDFSFTRFLVPYLRQYNGWAVFCDCDFVFTQDIQKLFNMANNKYAVMCVKHQYIPKTTMKMDGQVQKAYPKKNWSSMMLFNCSHDDCKTLDIDSVSRESGAWLHQMKWTNDENIGEVPLEWNFLVGEYDKESLNGKTPAVLHYTLGCPFMEGYENCDFADEYNRYAQ